LQIQLLSDLHTEHYESPLAFIARKIPLPRVDVRILAGDIVSVMQQSVEQIAGVFNLLTRGARHTIYVPGNHEYYLGTGAQVDGYLRSISSKITDFTMLENEEFWFEGQQFFGGAMWFDFKPDNYIYSEGAKAWSDFNDIKDLKDWVYQRNAAFTEAALRLVKPGCVVVSHHLPNFRSVHESRQSSEYNRFFVSNQTQVMFENGVRLWVHGHTHDACDYVFGDTRVVCNPYGYYWIEKPHGYPPVIMDV